MLVSSYRSRARSHAQLGTAFRQCQRSSNARQAARLRSRCSSERAEFLELSAELAAELADCAAVLVRGCVRRSQLSSWDRLVLAKSQILGSQIPGGPSSRPKMLADLAAGLAVGLRLRSARPVALFYPQVVRYFLLHTQLQHPLLITHSPSDTPHPLSPGPNRVLSTSVS